jgi:FkbM family methyltransferase
MQARKYTYYLSSIAKLLTGVQEWPSVVRMFLRPGRAGAATIRLRQSGVQFRVRGAMDVWIVKETYLDRFYERFGTPVGDGWNVVDVGAGIGDFTLYASLGHPQNRVYAFEPFPESFHLLQENLRINGVTNVQAFPEAIGAQRGSLLLDLSRGEPLQFSTEVASQSRTTLSVPCLSLPEALERLGVKRCHLLKLDVEGAEFDILFSTPDPILGQIEHIVMEYHDGVTPYGHGDLARFLHDKGFQVRTWPSPVHHHLGFLYAFR